MNPLEALADEPEPGPRVDGVAKLVGEEMVLDIKGVPVEVHEGEFLNGDFGFLFRHFRMDPAKWEVVGDSFSASSWEQSARSKNGDRDRVWLYAYKGLRFRLIGAGAAHFTDDDLAQFRARVNRWRPRPRKAASNAHGAPATLAVKWADWQAGKGSIPELEDRVLDSIEQTIEQVRQLRRLGRNVPSLAIANMGDPIEGCYGQYDSQAFTVTATKRQQLNAVLDLWAAGIRELAPHFDDVLFVSVLSNHGEWTRPPGGGAKPVTSDSDNADGFLADRLSRELAGRPGLEHVRFEVPHDEMTVTVELSGVQVALAHGHKMPGSPKELAWLQAQSLRILRDVGVEPRLWFTAHRHHLDVRDFGSFFRIQCPTLEISPSKWYADATGLWSTPGTLTCLVGEHEQAGGPLAAGGRGWSDLAVLPVRSAA